MLGPAPHLNEHRHQPRRPTFLSALVRFNGGDVAVRIRNLSRDGALIDADRPMPVGTAVTLRRGEIAIPGIIAWSQGGQCGLRFDRAIALGAWTPALARQDQMAVDQRIEAVRRDGNDPPREDPPVPDSLHRRLAEELKFSQRRIAAALDVIASYPPAVMKLAGALQELEVTSQAIGHVATLLESDDPDDTLRGIGMDELKRRLTRR